MVAVVCPALFGADAFVSAASTVRNVNAPVSVKCDSCRSMLERFTSGWEKVVSKQASQGRADAKDGPPTITYNQEIEDYLRGFCSSEEMKDFSPAIRNECEAVMEEHRRQVVATFLSVPEKIGSVGRKTKGAERFRKICGELAGVCDTNFTEMGKLSRCEACRRVVADAHFVLRRTHVGAAANDAYTAADLLEPLCSDAWKRYDDDPRKVDDVCEAIQDEHMDDLVKAVRQDDQPDTIAVCSNLGFCKKTQASRKSNAEQDEL